MRSSAVPSCLHVLLAGSRQWTPRQVRWSANVTRTLFSFKSVRDFHLVSCLVPNKFAEFHHHG